MTKLPRSIKRLFPNVTKTKDATKPVSVVVTESDSRNGKKKKATECAMAKAVCRKFKADGAIIGLGSSWVIKKDTAIRFQTPPSVQREIVSFDRSHSFDPGEYRLSAVEPSRRTGKKKPSGRKPPGQAHQPKRRHFTAGVRMMNVAGGSDD